MLKDKLITLRKYETMTEALFEQELLRENNIECTITEGNSVEVWPMFSEINEGLRILVFEKDMKMAFKVLEDYHKSVEK